MGKIYNMEGVTQYGTLSIIFYHNENMTHFSNHTKAGIISIDFWVIVHY